MIHSLGDNRKKLALDVLSWVFSAVRPLKPRELQVAVAVEEDDTEIEADFLTDESTLIDVCGGLVSIDENSQRVRFVHYSVQEYFENNPDVLSGAHTMIALTCLTYLSFDCFANTPSRMRMVSWLRPRVRKHALYSYAARNWDHHICIVEQDTHVLEKLVTFSDSGLRMETAVQFCLGFPGYMDSFVPNSNNLLFVAATRGSLHLAQFCIEQCNLPGDTTIRGIYGQPLSLAAARGHEGVVRFLAARDDVNVDSHNVHGRTALWQVAFKRHAAVVQFLAERDDVDADRKDIFGTTALSIAAESGEEAVVQFLAARGDVNVDSQSTRGRTPLHMSAINGHAAVVQFLAEREDVDADRKDISGATALSMAAWNGHAVIVQFLVERDDVDADRKDEYGATPFSITAQKGHGR